MVYLFIKSCLNVSPVYSSVVNLWKDVEINTYFVSRDFQPIINPTNNIDKSYMLLYEPEPIKRSQYRDFLTDCKQVSNQDFMLGFVEYGGGKWKLNQN